MVCNEMKNVDYKDWSTLNDKWFIFHSEGYLQIYSWVMSYDVLMQSFVNLKMISSML